MNFKPANHKSDSALLLLLYYLIWFGCTILARILNYHFKHFTTSSDQEKYSKTIFRNLKLTKQIWFIIIVS